VPVRTPERPRARLRRGDRDLAKLLGESGRFDAVVGADLMPRPAGLPAAILWLAQDLNHPLGLAAASFDALVSVEVIEHLENPRAVASDWYRLLKPGGRLFFTTPDADSWRSLATLALKGHHQEFTDENYPAHITALVGADLTRILAEAGFVGSRDRLRLDFAALWRRDRGQPAARLDARPPHRQARGGHRCEAGADPEPIAGLSGS
jgi:SAM-dependent methyltransferase